MSIPEFILRLREKVGTEPLWLSGSTAVVLRTGKAGPEVLLVQRADTAEWAPVSGIVDPGEHPHLAAVREVAEETCVVAEVERLVWLAVTETITYANGDQTQYIDHVFRCRYVSGDPRPGDGEALQAAFFPVDALPPMTARQAACVRVAVDNQPEARLGDLA